MGRGRGGTDPIAGQEQPPLPDDRVGSAIATSGVQKGKGIILEAWASEWAHPHVVDRAAGQLATEPDIFLDRAKNLIRVDDREHLGATLQILDPADLEYLFHRANIAVKRFKRRDDGTLGSDPVAAPKALRHAICAWRPQAANWNRIRGLASCPYLLGDGAIVNAAGLDARTGLWLPRDQVVSFAAPISARGFSQDRATEAVLTLLHPLNEFPWASLEMDRAVWVSYLLTMVTRPAYRICPFFVFDANDTGSGKDLVATCAEMIAMGRQANRSGMDTDPKENEKNIATALEAGDTTVILGDVPDIGVRLLVRLLTELDNVRVRRLGGNTTIPVPPSLILGCTANNVKSSLPDMIRRSVRLRLESKEVDPRNRKTKQTQTQLLGAFQANRAACLADCFEILRGFLTARAGGWRPAEEGLSASAFPDWAALVRDCIRWLGLPDIVQTQDSLRKTLGSERDKFGHLFAAIWNWMGLEAWRSSAVITLLHQVTLSPEERAVKAAVYETFDEPQKLTSTRLSRALTPLRDKPFELPGLARMVAFTIPGEGTYALKTIKDGGAFSPSPTPPQIDEEDDLQKSDAW